MEVYDLANIKSAKKRILVSRTRADRNKAIRSGVKTAIKKVYAAVESGDKEAAKAALLNATTVIDKAASKGIIHKNQAANRKSGVMQLANTIVTDADRAAYVKPEPKKQEATGNKKAAKKAERKAAYSQSERSFR